jgi:hypothetical protein
MKKGMHVEADDRSVLWDVIVKAAGFIGSDGKGKDGLVGYFTTMARKQPEQFGKFLGQVLPYHVSFSQADNDNSFSHLTSADLEKLSPQELVDLWEKVNRADRQSHASGNASVARDAIIKAAGLVGFDECRRGGALDHYRRRQVGRDQGIRRPPLPTPPLDRGEEVLALRGERRAPSPIRRRSTAGAH